jgi:hypothetical protein
VLYDQGDQIGRNAHWIGRLFSLGNSLNIAEEAQNFGLLVSEDKVFVLRLTKNGLGYISGNVFKNSSGHHVYEQAPVNAFREPASIELPIGINRLFQQ